MKRFTIGFVLATMISCSVTSASDAPAVVKSSGTHSHEVTTLRMEELWHVGGSDEEYLLGLVCDAVADREGNVYLLDAQLADVKVFSADGEYLKTLSRQGEGPGETLQPRILLLPEHGGLGIVQDFPPKIVWLNAKGESAGSSTPGLPGTGEAIVGKIRSAKCCRGRLLIACSALRMVEGRPHEVSLLGRFDLQGSLLNPYLEISRPMGSQPDLDADCDIRPFKTGAWDVDSNGRMYSLQDCEPYRVTVQDSLGTRYLVIEREYQRRRRGADEMKRIEEEYRNTEGARRDQNVRVADHAPAISSLRVAGNDEVWVHPDQDCANRGDGVFAEYDVFSSKGEFVRHVRLVGGGNCMRDSWHFISDDRVIVVRDYHRRFAAHEAPWAGVAQEEETGRQGDREEGVICYSLRD
ncbi:MAG: hypothetical protein KAY24_09885 [Candidatus Eisenbacteria sp.]|nr:hypothetical protein [Candidatus Eisenbacteria bacterium]